MDKREKDREYDALWAKYNTAIAQVQDLREQLATKQEQWSQRDKEFKRLEKLMRELCEAICAKDRKEMVLGENYS